MGRKGHIEVFPDGIGFKVLSLPEKIVMVGDGRNPVLRDELAEREAERDVHRYRQGVLDDQDVERKLAVKRLQLVLQRRGVLGFVRSSSPGSRSASLG